VNRALFGRTLAAYRVRVVLCALGVFAWGLVPPMIYATFGRQLAAFIQGNPLFSQFSQFGGGDIFSVTGTIALGFIHPFTIVLLGIFAVGFSTVAVAGERQRGTLEVVLARPISRHAFYTTLFVAGALFLALLLALEVVANSLSATVMGVAGGLSATNIVLLWLNGWLLFVAYMAVGFAASVSFDRLAPALGVTLVFVLVNYLLDVIGSLWPDAAWIERYSMFHLVQAKQVLEHGLPAGDALLLGAIAAIAIGYAWIVFPRRDLAAPV